MKCAICGNEKSYTMNQKCPIGCKDISLKYKEKKILEVDHSDLETFIQKVYGHKDFEIADSEEWNNYSNYNFSISKVDAEKEANCEYNSKKFDAFVKSGKGRYVTRLILLDLCEKDLIPEGEYSIKVFW